MTQYINLLKKAELFEKMAMYGDRKSFLKAIATNTVTLPESIKNEINALVGILSATSPNSFNLQNKLLHAMDTSNLEDLFNNIQEAANAIPGDRTAQVQNALDLSRKIQQLMTPQTAQSETVEAPAASKSTQQTTVYPPIPKETQDQLNKLLVPAGNIMPLKLDGQKGPLTNKALEIFTAKYNVPATVQSIKEVYLRENNPDIVTKTPF